MNKFFKPFFLCLLPGIFTFFCAQTALANEIKMKTALTDSASVPWPVALENSSDPQLQKFAEYQARCRKAFGGAMVVQCLGQGDEVTELAGVHGGIVRPQSDPTSQQAPLRAIGAPFN